MSGINFNDTDKKALIGIGSLTDGTPGSIFFAGALGELAQDNLNFFWDDANNRLGIGTNVPATTLDVNGPATLRGGANYFEDGVTGSPVITFTNDTDTGLYRESSGKLAFSSDGTDALYLSYAGGFGTILQINSAGMRLQDTAGVEFISFTGLASPWVFGANIGSVDFSQVVRLQDGSAASPAMTFLSDTDTGISSNDINELGLSTGGSMRLR